LSQNTDVSSKTVDPAVVKHVQDAIQWGENYQWEKMETAAQEALALDAEHVEAQQLQQKAQFERSNEETLEQLEVALKSKATHEIARLYAKIDENSKAKLKADPLHEEYKNNVFQQQVEKAQKAATQRRCADLERIISEVPSQWSDLTMKLQTISCVQKPAGIAVKRPKPIVKSVKPNKRLSEDTSVFVKKTVKVEGPPFQELIDQASASMRDHHYGKGLKLCTQALRIQPSNQQATMICGMAACRLKKSALAKKFMHKIHGATRKANLRQICITSEVPGFID